MSAWNEHDAIICMRELCCENIENAHKKLRFALKTLLRITG